MGQKLSIIALFITLLYPWTAKAEQPLITDISSHLISVTSDFTGTDLLLFGAIKSVRENNPARHGDIIIAVRGPHRDLLVRKKERVLGIWANTQSVDMAHIPGFYALFSNRPIDEITDQNTLERLRLGPTRLSYQSQNPGEEFDLFKEAIIRKREEENLFLDNEKGVQILGKQLFRASIHLPANVPVGNYLAEVYFFEDGDLISAQTSPLFIKKFGLGRTIYDFANEYPALHGIAAIILALLAGWIASALFRKE